MMVAFGRRGVEVLLWAIGAMTLIVPAGPATAIPVAAGHGAIECAPRPAGAIVAGTTPEDVERLVRDFARAYNRGDVEQLELIFAPEPDFEWYAVQDERIAGSAEDRSTLMPYFERRHRLRDRIRILAVRASEEPAWHGGYDFSFELRRRSSDPRATGRYHGKGAGACSIFTWSMGAET